MQDEVLFSITRVTDDETGMYSIGDLDFAIKVGTLTDYLKRDPIGQRNKLFAWMGVMTCQIDRYANELMPKDQAYSATPTPEAGV